MAALLVGMSVMAILMSVAMPVWHQVEQREKEAELVFRGQQYARAIGLFQKKAGPGVSPPNVEMLVEQRFLRRRYKDPITGQDFNFLTVGQTTTGSGSGSPQASGRGTTGRGAGLSVTASQGNVAPASGRGAGGGILGVASKSKASSILIYNGRTHYDEWQFLYVQQTPVAGVGGPTSAGGAGGRGQPQRGGNGQQRPPASGERGGRGGRGA